MKIEVSTEYTTVAFAANAAGRIEWSSIDGELHVVMVDNETRARTLVGQFARGKWDHVRRLVDEA